MLKFDAGIFDAVEAGDLETVKCFWNENIDVNYQGLAGMTLLMYATSNGHVDIINFLLQMNPDTALKDNKEETAYNKALNSSIRKLLNQYKLDE